ncbi:hypothetical protein [Arthrobacter sp. 18067]|uniref:barstar family protein n=1 Tax=Arthrobacter sp. 18067 TaxID=2681413 RepID=UPI0013587697|nr:hypothetical protein [Arthrobacter sp. 18067]
MKIDEISNQFAVHLGVAAFMLDQLVTDARAHQMIVFELNLEGLPDVTALTQYLEAEFKYPYKTAGLNAAMDLISDLEWFENAHGFVVTAHGASEISPVAADFVRIFPIVLDRWRAHGIPFIVAIEEDGDHLLAALQEANDFLKGAGQLPQALPGVGPVAIVVHPTEGEREESKLWAASG